MAASLPPPIQLYQLATAHYHSQALYVAAKLGIADHLADGPRDAEALAAATQTHAPSLRRVLRLLVALGVFAENADGTFALTPLSTCLQSGPGSSRASVQLFAGPTQSKVWSDLMRTVETGEPAFHRLFGQGSFEYFDEHPEEAAVFDEAMSGFTAMIARVVPDAYDLSAVTHAIDIGGGNGALMMGLLRQVPSLQGAIFDLPRVRETAERHLAQSDVGDRCRFHAGDFFESVPSGYDLYLAKHVIHDWNDERATAILRTIRRAIGDSDAKLALLEGLYPDEIDATTRGAAANDCNMMLATGGKQRSRREFRHLYEEAGFQLTRIVSTGMVSVIEGAPR